MADVEQRVTELERRLQQIQTEHDALRDRVAVLGGPGSPVFEAQLRAVTEKGDIDHPEQRLRRYLWRHHGHPKSAREGDDYGDMRCNAPGCAIDFRRESLQAVFDKLKAQEKGDV